ncbi:MAG: NAD(P)H-dependent oxidoreductase [Saprospiraceae bacterium]|uniref:NAD(P)H-dependent oxidoreductase n=1 Tax=Candidatus Opimibacter skivensis TaxID=2982028 RepID=A0A9D7XRA3_9BACT|nr:NAD(P)H-dependent oxidoreductase [Candidatus Opimibacter skivensis]
MKILIISYSFTGNNDALAATLASELKADHIKVTENKLRTTGKIFFDILLNRIPEVNPKIETVKNYDLVIFMGPVWMGKIATPLRGYFKQLKTTMGKYAFVSISGGADGPNIKLRSELHKRIGKEPAALIDMHIADLLPPEPKPERKDTSDYHLREEDVKSLTNKIVKILREDLLDQNLFILAG